MGPSYDLAKTALKRNTVINVVLKLGLSACIYYLWLERNKRIHGGTPSSHNELILSILQCIRDRAAGVPRLGKIYSTTELQFLE